MEEVCTDLAVEVSELEVEKATGEAAESQIWAEACWAGQQRVGIHPRTLKVSHPRLEKDRDRERHRRTGREGEMGDAGHNYINGHHFKY